MKKLLLTVALVILVISSAQSVTIVADFKGTAPTNSVGSGNWTNVCLLACRVWQTALPGPGTLVIHFMMSPDEFRAHHYLESQGGDPHRETEATIVFNGNPSFRWFMDSDPLCTATYNHQSLDLGGGPINVSRYRDAITEEFSMDLFTTALHEIGHSLGLSSDNTSFNLVCTSGFVGICGSLPYTGTMVPLTLNDDGYTSHIADVATGNLMSGLIGWCQRALPSALDIVTVAQLSGYTEVNPDLSPILSIGHPASVAGRPMPPILELSWIQPLAPPAGTEYRVQMCTDMASGVWTDIEGDPVVSNGTYRQLVTKTGASAFFRLKAEPIAP